MKHFILLIFVLLPFCTFSQIDETFDGPDLNLNWIGARDSFEITTDGRLQLCINPKSSGTTSIGVNIDYASDMQWEFDVQMNGAPSDNNKLCAYLYREKDAFYYVRIGFNKKNGVDSDLALRKSETDLFPRNENSYQKGMWMHIKVTLEANRIWTMYSRQHDVSYYVKEGTCELPVAPEERGQFSFKFFYTETGSQLFSIDNVCIRHKVTPTDTVPAVEPDVPDPSPDGLPQLIDLAVLTPASLQFTFDKEVRIDKAIFSISGIGNAIQQKYADNSRKIVNTLFEHAMKSGCDYTISYSGVSDLSGRQLSPSSEDVTYEEEYVDDEEEPVSENAVVINEIMADPKGLTLLPETEYVELHNTTASPVSLKGWAFSYGGSAKVIGNSLLPAKGYAVLFRTGRTIQVDENGISVPMDNFPAALANTGKTLQLIDVSGKTVDEVTYTEATPARSWERSSQGEWSLSSDPRGGTPGSANRSEEVDIPDEPIEPDEPDLPVEPDLSPVQPGDLIFNELLPEPFTGGSEYIELYNRSDQTLSLKTLSVALRKTDGTLSTRYTLSPVTQVIEPGAYVLLTKSIEGVSSFYLITSPLALHEVPKLPILANTASTLVLFRTSDERIIDEVAYSSKWHASSVKDKKGVALERVSTEGKTQDPANWTSATEAVGYGTPGYKNSQQNTSSGNESTGIEAPVFVEEGNFYKILYNLETSGYHCRISVYNTTGIQMTEIANHELLGLTGQLTWNGSMPNGRKLTPGVYIFYAELYHPQGKVIRYKKPFLVH